MLLSIAAALMGWYVYAELLGFFCQSTRYVPSLRREHDSPAGLIRLKPGGEFETYYTDFSPVRRFRSG